MSSAGPVNRSAASSASRSESAVVVAVAIFDKIRFICDSVTAGGIDGVSAVGSPEAEADGTALSMSPPVAHPVTMTDTTTNAETTEADLPATRRPLFNGAMGFITLLDLILGRFGGLGSLGCFRRGPRERLK